MAKLPCLEKVATVRVAVIDELLGKPQMCGECFCREELVRGAVIDAIT